jgi:selenocysteine-specific elongation factor
MKNIIIGTAGHVDHGKTQLIKALSGIDTDRLSEEKKRGITIELGFAHIPNDEGYNIGVIDVPGHEKFIKNMLAGIGGIDFVLFVVAADEGIMPQTKEHFEILQTLGIDDGIIAITKKDMVDDEWLEMLEEDVTDYFKGSFLEGRPMIAVSSKTGENIAELKKEILKKCDREVKRIEDREMFRLPVDRVFSMSGFGTVVTGTLIDGQVSVNDEVRLFPEDIPVKVRGIQTYGKDVDTAVAGQRTAVNLAGIKKDDVSRGDVLAAPDAVCVTSMLDVSITMFRSSERTVLNNSRVHLYTGSSEVICKVILLDRDAVGAGETCYAQLRLEEPVSVRRGDRFIIRFYSPIVTIGGGRILDAVPEKHKRNRENIMELMEILDSGSVADIVDAKTSGRRFLTAHELAREIGVTKGAMDDVVKAEVEAGRIAMLEGGTLIGRSRMDFFREGMVQLIEEYHGENPLAEGIPKQELLSRLTSKWHIDQEKLVQALVTYFIRNDIIVDRGKFIALAGFRIEYTDEQKKLRDEIAKLYESAGLEMVKNDQVYEMGEQKVVAAILGDLADQGTIRKVDPSYYVSSAGWDEAVHAAIELGGSKGSFTLADYRDALGTSRKYASVLLQSLDRAGVTVFDGEKRSVIR